MSDLKTYPVCFTGEVGSIVCDAEFQKEKAKTFKRYIRFARENKASTLITCQCMSEIDNKRRHDSSDQITIGLQVIVTAAISA